MNWLDLLLVSAIILVVLYKVSYFHRKEIAYFSLYQLMMFMIFPAILFVAGLFYLDSLMDRELVKSVRWIGNGPIALVIIFATWTYAGAVIHGVAKMFASPGLLRYEDTKAGKMNRFFHLQFSHNLAASSAIGMLVSLGIAEASRLPIKDPRGLTWLIGKGVILGSTMGFSFLFYTRSEDEYKGYWRELRSSFIFTALGTLTLLLTLYWLDVRIWDYEIVGPVVAGLFVVNALGASFVIRRWYRWMKRKQRFGRFTPVASWFEEKLDL